MANGEFGKRFFSGLKGILGSSAPSPLPATDARPAAREFEIESTFEPSAADAAPAPPAPVAVRTPESVAAAAAFVATVKHLPLFSGTATQIVRSMGDEGVSARDLARLISTDAGLVAHLLRIVNSPYFGFAKRIVTVADALAVLGIDQARRLVTASILQRPLMAYLHDSTLVRAFWRHELLCAALARHLAQRSGSDTEAAYMAGLMHDVGRLAMVIEFPQFTHMLLPRHGDDDGTGLGEEVAEFGFDHAQVGGALLALWGLPPLIATAALHHADEFQPQDAMCACVWQANQLSHIMIDEPDEQEEELPWMTEIGLSVDGRRAIIEEIHAMEAGQD